MDSHQLRGLMFQIEKADDSFGKPCVRVCARGLNGVIYLIKATGDDPGFQTPVVLDGVPRSYFVIQCGAGRKVCGRLIWDGGPLDEFNKEELAELALKEAGLSPTAGWEDITAIAC